MNKQDFKDAMAEVFEEKFDGTIINRETHLIHHLKLKKWFKTWDRVTLLFIGTFATSAAYAIIYAVSETFFK